MRARHTPLITLPHPGLDNQAIHYAIGPTLDEIRAWATARFPDRRAEDYERSDLREACLAYASYNIRRLRADQAMTAAPSANQADRGLTAAHCAELRQQITQHLQQHLVKTALDAVSVLATLAPDRLTEINQATSARDTDALADILAQ